MVSLGECGANNVRTANPIFTELLGYQPEEICVHFIQEISDVA